MDEERPIPKRFFRLYACCIPVRGARRSTICDLQRGTYRFVPNALYEILMMQPTAPVAEISASYGSEGATIDHYFGVLEEEGLGFWTDEPERFPPLDLGWQRPERITNAIIDVGPDSAHPFGRILEELDELGCKALQLRFFRNTSYAELSGILEHTREGGLRSVELLIPSASDLDFTALTGLCGAYPRLSAILVHGASANGARSIPGLPVVITSIAVPLDSGGCCGEIHPGYFAPNVDVFTESQGFNTCLNRKISVDCTGDIRNCPSLPASYGNVRDTSLHAALAQRDFTALWEINKDQIAVCKDCEFRYICTDCRAFITDSSDMYSKPSKCSYDPYAARW